MKNSRKPAIFGSFTIAAFLALASVAYACTIFQGQMVVTPVDANGNAVGGSVTAIGNNRGMGWCSPFVGTATIPKGTSNLKIDITDASPACPTDLRPQNKLPKGDDYQVNWVNAEAMTRNPQRILIDCMSPIFPTDAALGVVNRASNISVDENGNASVTVSVTANDANILGESAICFSSPKGGRGNQAPVTVL